MRLRDVLIALDFEEDWGAPTEEPPCYNFDFGNLKLNATQLTNLYLRPVFTFSGLVVTQRSITEIFSDLPIDIECFEQGVAWIAYVIGSEFVPRRSVSWLDDGRRWSAHLPWEMERRAFEARPYCSVEREWFRVAAKKIRTRASSANADDTIAVRFDGKILSFDMPNGLLVMPAIGKAWDMTYLIQLSLLSRLASRIMRETVSLSVWENQIRFDGHRFPVIQEAQRDRSETQAVSAPNTR